ncbi:nuclear protein localization protein 4 [Dispira simplex]|nr:nuclear protein localization protein 4 [Dispira simplex]
MVIRVRTNEGMHRLQIPADGDVVTLQNELTQILSKEYSPSDVQSISFYRDASCRDQLALTPGQPLPLAHGDLVYAKLPSVVDVDKSTSSSGSNRSAGATLAGGLPAQTPVSTTTTSLDKSSTAVSKPRDVQEYSVDQFLEEQPGLIKRPRDSRFCTHASQGMCDYCMPLEPFDRAYLEEQGIKHMSFHSYLRQITATARASGSQHNGIGVTVGEIPQGTDQLIHGKRVILPPLEEPSFKVKVPCPAGHPDWPVSICTKCQPSSVTLQRQSYRMVDHVCFANSDLVDHFIQYWRQTGTQRFGYLYGRYEPYLEVPLGVQAVVEAIYEPPQNTAVDGIKVDMTWAEEKQVDRMAELCGLVKVGMIFTDLVDDGSGTGAVVCKRHIGSYFMSSLECVFAAQMQLRNPNPCKWSPSGHFGSKFVTCVVSGNGDGGIDITAYQMTTVAMAMVDADIIEPTVDPSQMRVKPADAKRYVPDVIYKYKNEYNTTVSRNAKPVFPVEYLLTTVTHGFPAQPNPQFGNTKPFVVANRPGMSSVSENDLFTHLFGENGQDLLANHLRDFHLLCYIALLHVLSDHELEILAQAANQPSDATLSQLEESPGWRSFHLLLSESGQRRTREAKGKGPSTSDTEGTSQTMDQDYPMATDSPVHQSNMTEWSCRHCTYVNPSVLDECDMCGLPRDQ